MNSVGESGTLLTADDLAALIEAVATHRDRAAFTVLFGHFAPRVKGFLINSGLPDLMAEEVTQETLLIMWRKASYFDPKRAGLSTWIFTIARNQRIDRLRRERGKTRDGGPGITPDPGEEPDLQPTGEDLAIERERGAHVRAALEQLPKEQAMIVRMSFFAEKPHAEIAAELGIPLGTVKSRVRLALSRLRGLLDSEL